MFFKKNELLTVVRADVVCTQVRMNSCLSAEERLRKTEPVHDVNKVIQCVVEYSVQLLPSQSYCLDCRQGPSMQLCLQGKHKYFITMLAEEICCQPEKCLSKKMRRLHFCLHVVI